MPGPDDDFWRIRKNGETQKFRSNAESKKTGALKIPFMDLAVGPNTYIIRFYGKLKKNSFEKKLESGKPKLTGVILLKIRELKRRGFFIAMPVFQSPNFSLIGT